MKRREFIAALGGAAGHGRLPRMRRSECGVSACS